jgi:CheY-like chemotaxis protein
MIADFSPALAMTLVSATDGIAVETRLPVVLVDDDDAVRSVLCFSLRRLGCKVESFATGIDALKWLEDNRCCFVLTDLFMPDIDGIEVIRWLRLHRPETRVAAISGDEHQARSLFTTAGFAESLPVLSKPFTYSDLEDLVAQMAEPGRR